MLVKIAIKIGNPTVTRGWKFGFISDRRPAEVMFEVKTIMGVG